MRLPKQPSDVRYLSSDAFNCYVDFIDPNAGQAADGTPNPPLTVASGVHANVAQWRSKEVDKPQTRIGQFSYKVTIRFPRTFSVNAGMQLLLTRAGSIHVFNIEGVSDPDMQGVELHIWCWTNNDAVVNK